MDLPPSGWYPDPYGTPLLLRWWDGATWTQHTHPDQSAGPEQGAGRDAGASTGQVASARHALQETSPQPAAGELRRTKPPTGRPTQPQPALPDTVSPAAYQPAVTTVGPAVVPATTVQPAVPATTVQPAVPATRVQSAVPGSGVQPTMVQPGYPQPAMVAAMAGASRGPGEAGTQVLFMGGEPWQGGPGGPGPGAPGTPGPGADPGNRYGYQQARARRRRRWVIAGVAGGAAVAAVVITVIATSGGGSPAATADQTKLPPTTSPSAAAPAPSSAPPSPTPSASASPTSATTGSVLSDGAAGVSYAQLAAPWQSAGCAPSLASSGFTWTDGEYAVAGPVNGGSATWYGEACSGPLPATYGYTGTTDLQNTAQQLAESFSGTYYNNLNHTVAVEQDQAASVGGHSAWEVTWDVSYTTAAAQGATWTDEQAAVVVVDPGTGAAPAVFFTSVPATLNESNVSTLVSSLAVTGTPAAGTAPTVAPPATTPAVPGASGTPAADQNP